MTAFAIDVHDLCKTFGHLQAVKDFSIHIPQGKIFGFLGPNGSGKTTTIRMLCGLLKIDTGYGTCLGYNIRTQTRYIKRHVGYMTQRFSLYDDFTVRENLELVARIYGVRSVSGAVTSMLKQIGLSEYEQQMTSTLSGGWKQRLALAACMIHKPLLLLLDEPTAGVDPQARRDFWNQIHHFAAQGTTVLVSTHYMDEVERCHEIAYILKGQLIAQGPIENILSQSGMVTWVVTGSNPLELASKLETLPGIDQIGFTGSALRVSSKTPELIEKTLEPFRDAYIWQKTPPSAEDLFVLMAKETQ